MATKKADAKRPPGERLLEWIALHFRWVFVIWFLLPVSVLYDLYVVVRDKVIYFAQSAPNAHNRKVALIQQQVRKWNDEGRQTKLCNARPGWLSMSFRTPKYKKELTPIKTNTLIDILEFNEEERYIRVEPMVTMGQLTRFLIPRGWTLPIVPELDDLTVGGMINGCGVESSGKRYGLFQHTCLSFDIVTADGELVVASKDKTEEKSTAQGLFFGTPWSHGTLGFLVAATIRIVPCKPWVKLTYFPCNSLKKTHDKLEKDAFNKDIDFVEGIQFDLQHGVVISGTQCEEPPKNGLINRIGSWHKPWFFTHVEKILKKKKIVTEYVPLRDYYHRHSRSIFWEIQDIIQFGNNFLFRYLLGWASPPKISLLKLTTPRILKKLYERVHVLQDMLIPLSELEDALELFHKEVEIYPIWLCPFNFFPTQSLARQGSGSSVMYVDVGVYGNTKVKTYDAEKTTRKLEKYVRSVKGYQMLYADTYMTRSEFYEMFDSTLYDWLRVKYGCKDAFPDVYEKVCRAARE
uniref:Delta(24)-sterol reductase n=1 Tax=Steinernema glaseri TaxID=37863 RepID=A0A1I8A8N4_9BILA